ncbi:hypothetical protein MZD87_07745 [Pediococcus pentosaceus]|uniref:hypothetical protein n=1 Tax=Pediococcus pentosaceus TaxID=1255 RepID=UPI00211A877F|nr:hypothetical protein [Pediococcus pentosaceus]MCQ9196976.1 hypothetical protein [Pediococcus pentosaceus]
MYKTTGIVESNNTSTLVPKENSWIEISVILLYELLLTLFFLQNSMFRYQLNVSLLMRAQLVTAFLMFCISFLILKKNDLVVYFLGVLLVAAGAVNYLTTGYTNFIILSLVVFAMRNVSLRHILKYTLITLVFLTALVFVLSSIGKIDNLLYYRDGLERSSFGTIYPLSMSGYLFSISICMTLVTNRYRFFRVILLLLLSYLTLTQMGARNDSITIAALAIVLLMKPFFSRMYSYKGTFIPFFVIIVILLSNFLTVIIPYGTKLYWMLNSVLSQRMSLQDTLIHTYGMSLFGRQIAENGNGGIEGKNLILKYFYVDNSYARILFMGGILLFVVFVFCVFRRLRILLANKNIFFTCVFIIFLVNGITQDSLQNPAYSVLLPTLLSSGNLLKFDSDYGKFGEEING